MGWAPRSTRADEWGRPGVDEALFVQSSHFVPEPMNDAARVRKVSFQNWGLPAENYRVRDIWEKRDLPIAVTD
jgi:hypothetical protein